MQLRFHRVATFKHYSEWSIAEPEALVDKKNCCIKWGMIVAKSQHRASLSLYSFSCFAIFFFQCSNSSNSNNLHLRLIQQTRSTIRSLLLYSSLAFIMPMVQLWNSAYRLYRNTIMREAASRIHFKSLNCQRNGAFCLSLRYLVRFAICTSCFKSSPTTYVSIDGAHQKDEDFAYFHLPPVPGWPVASSTLFGISCNRQIATKVSCF